MSQYEPQFPDDGPMARFEAAKVDPNLPSEVFARIAEGESLKQIAATWRLPKARFAEWYMTEHGKLYDAALKVAAADLAMQALDAADAGLDKDDVPAARLAADVRLRLASKFDRDRYGDSVTVNKNVNVTMDAGLVGYASALLQQIGKRPGIKDRVARTLTISRDEEGTYTAEETREGEV